MSVPYDVWRQYLIPQHGLSRFAGLLANSKRPKLKNYLIRYFLGRYHVDMSEARIEDPYAYKSFNDFFTRKLKEDARPISEDPQHLISPADSTLYQFGRVEEDTLLRAKNHAYVLSSLLGRKDDLSQTFSNGHYYCFYLAPHNYHRVHMPCTGNLLKMRYIPGRLFSVNQSTAEHVEHIFARNERVVAFFEGDCGKFAVILVGAMLVGNIHTSWMGKVAPSDDGQIKELDYKPNSVKIARGQEVGHFAMGSTAIVLFEKQIKPLETLRNNQNILMGESIASF